MAPSINKIDDFLESSRIMLENASADATIKAELAKFGYDEMRLQGGKIFYDQAATLQAAQKKEFGEQVAATAELDTLWNEVEEMYMKTLKVARVALKENPKLGEKLLLYGDRKRSLSGWMEQVRIFYINLTGDTQLLSQMAKFGYTSEKLKNEVAKYQQLADQSACQKKEIGEAQAATIARDKALDTLASFISDLRAVAKVALAANPQQLEKLGILARSPGAAPRKKQAPEEQEEDE